MPLIALSLSEELEKFGAYAGLAAFFGFAVLTILYFAQAREVKRLREWAGRAPERAAELEARVAADAARRATMPVRQPPPAAATAVPGPSTPAGAPAAAGAAATAATAAPPADTGPGNGAPATDGAPPAGPREGESGAAESGAAESDVAESDAAEGQAAAEGPAEPSGAPATDGPTGGESPAAAEPRPGGNGAGAAPAVPSIPRATPPPSRPQPGGPPPPRRPAPAASLRQPPPATRRPGQPPARRPAGAPTERSRSRTALAIGGGLLAAAAAVLIGVGLFGGGEDRPAPNVPTPAEPTATPGATEPEAAANEPARGDTTVAVLNGTTVTGLAAQIADDIEGAGFIRGATANYSDQARSASLVFYEEEFRRRAQEVARIIKLPVEDIEPITDDVRSLAGEADVVVVVGADQAP